MSYAVVERDMASGSGQWKVPEESLRIAHPQKIYLKFSSSETSVEEYLVDLSMTGMFVRCSDPPRPGTLFGFKMQLASGEPAAEGEAVVVWIREQQQRLSHPRGMGVRFTKLDPGSRSQIRTTVERYTRVSGDPGELQNLRSVVEETLGDVLDPRDLDNKDCDPKERDPKDRDPRDRDPRDRDPEDRMLEDRDLEDRDLEDRAKPSRGPGPEALPARKTPLILTAAVPAAAQAFPSVAPGRTASGDGRGVASARGLGPWGWIGGALLLIAAIATGWAWYQGRGGMPPSAAGGDPEASVARQEDPPSPSQQEPVSEDFPAPAESGQVLSALTPSELTPSEAEEPAPIPPTPEQQVLENLNAWASAWARQDAETYLDFYSSFFRPPRNQARIAWRQDRRERIERPQRIELEIRNTKTEPLGDSRFRVVFEQTYRSETFQDTVTKVLEWVLEGEDWKIVKEDSAG